MSEKLWTSEIWCLHFLGWW